MKSVFPSSGSGFHGFGVVLWWFIVVCGGLWQFSMVALWYRLGTVNSKSFVSKVLLRIKWKFELNQGL